MFDMRLLISMLFLASTASPQIMQPLFVIERNKNSNVVHYDAQLDVHGKLDQRQPVVAYWVMNAEDGRREELNWLERQNAYGFEIRQDDGSTRLSMSLKPCKERVISIVQNNQRVHAIIMISGKLSYLQRIFIWAQEDLMPRVKYIELFGCDVEDGSQRYEKIVYE